MLRSGRRRTRLESSRFAPRRRAATGSGGPALIRFRRNRELMAREAVVMVLWGGLTLLLASLASTLWRVSQIHLAERAGAVRLALPALAVLAAAGCLWRARRALAEFLDIRREQAGLTHRLRDPGEGEGEA